MNSAEISDYYTTDRPELVAFTRCHGPYATALDIGCAAGILGQSLQQAGVVLACDGIEPNSEAAGLAQTRLRQVWNGTLESLIDQVPWRQYDLIILADVLEHLVDPWHVLRQLQSLTAPGCKLLLSVPNVRHYKVSLSLLWRGEFRYTDQGIMDRTHLHFFTRDSLVETLHECGWKTCDIGSHMRSRYRRRYMPTRLLEPFVAVQYLVIASKQ